MDAIELHAIDALILVGYLILVAYIGLRSGKGIKTSKDLFLAGKTLPWWAVGMSLVVSDIGAKDMIGLAGDGYRYGIVMMNYDFIGCIFPVMVAAFLFLPFFWLAGVYTVPEYLGMRYNAGVRTFFAVLWVLFMVLTLATLFVSSAAMFKVLLGWSFWFSVGLTAAVVGAYTCVGGLKAVVYTDALSCCVLIVGASLICLFGLREVGGIEGIQSTVNRLDWTRHHLDLLPPADHPEYPWPALLLGLGFVLGPAYWIGNQAIVQRSLGARSQSEARASYVFCAVIKLVFPVLLVLPGLIAVSMYHEKLGQPGEGWDGNLILPQMVMDLLPTGLLGLVLGAFMAGVLSNLDSYVNSASTMLVQDLYKPWIRPHADDRFCLLLGRWLVFGLLLAGALASYPVSVGFGSVFEAFQTGLTFFQGPLLALLLCGMLTTRATAPGGVVGMMAGVGCASVLHLGPLWLGWENKVPILYVAWWSFVVAFVGVWIGSWASRPEPIEKLKGLVCWLPGKDLT